MIIDFHTHIFPDALAKKALSVLVANINNSLVPVNDGTLAGLMRNMDAWNIDVSVIQPVVTKPSQMKTTNEWAAGICSDRIVSFGGISPHSDDYKSDIDFVVSLGLKGLKFHPEYQDFVVDDTRMMRIYDYAFSKGLIIMVHAGVDIGLPPPYKSSPQQFARVVRTMQGGVMIAAHFGGHGQWDDVDKYLIGENIYLDTSMGFEFFEKDRFVDRVRAHGTDKILFASDSPWSSALTEAQTLCGLPLTEEEKTAILGGSAKRLLTI